MTHSEKPLMARLRRLISLAALGAGLAAPGCDGSVDYTWSWHHNLTSHTDSTTQFGDGDALGKRFLSRAALTCDLSCVTIGGWRDAAALSSVCASLAAHLGCVTDPRGDTVHATATALLGPLPSSMTVHVALRGGGYRADFSARFQLETEITGEPPPGELERASGEALAVGVGEFASTLTSDIGSDAAGRAAQIAYRDDRAHAGPARVEVVAAEARATLERLNRPGSRPGLVEFELASSEGLVALRPTGWEDLSRAGRRAGSDPDDVRPCMDLSWRPPKALEWAHFFVGPVCGPSCSVAVEPAAVMDYELGRFAQAAGLEPPPSPRWPDKERQIHISPERLRVERWYTVRKVKKPKEFAYAGGVWSPPDGPARVRKDVAVGPDGRLIVATYPDGETEVVLVRARPMAKRYLVCSAILPTALAASVDAFEDACRAATLLDWDPST